MRIASVRSTAPAWISSYLTQDSPFIGHIRIAETWPMRARHGVRPLEVANVVALPFRNRAPLTGLLFSEHFLYLAYLFLNFPGGFCIFAFGFQVGLIEQFSREFLDRAPGQPNVSGSRLDSKPVLTTLHGKFKWEHDDTND